MFGLALRAPGQPKRKEEVPRIEDAKAGYVAAADLLARDMHERLAVSR